MEKININIPDNLTPQQELLAIAKKLGKKMLPTGQQAIGTGYEIKHLETTITITRTPSDKLTIARECGVCKSLFAPKGSFALWINYGGVKKQRHFCSNECREFVIGICGESRTSISKSKLKSII